MSTTTHRRSLDSTDTVSKFHAEAPQATASEELVQGPYVVARAEDKQEDKEREGGKGRHNCNIWSVILSEKYVIGKTILPWVQ